MWLVNCESLKLESFTGSKIPEYAILSHTWEEEEVTFQGFDALCLSIDSQDPQVQNLVYSNRPKGYRKIYESCLRALRHDYKYIWIDTCCINKDSSAELTESINSMFQWYKNAAACYVFLSDLSEFSPSEKLVNCKWFTRGWTLQELIAPKEVFFYNRAWKYVGTRHEFSHLVSKKTGIDRCVLLGRDPLAVCSVATRMSWAASRETTRTEDLAYCLLGIFEVNMPMIYGEGANAFRRLQEEIVRRNNDLTILAWDQDKEEEAHLGIFAPSPAAFANSNGIEQIPQPWLYPVFSMTNKGLRIDEFKMLWNKAVKDENGDTLTIYSIPLGYRGKDDSKWIAMPLRKIGPNLFIRNGRLLPSPWNKGNRLAGSVYLHAAPTQTENMAWRMTEAAWFASQDLQIQEVIPESHWDEANSLFFAPLDDFGLVLAVVGIITVGNQPFVPVKVVVCINYNRTPPKCRIFEAVKHVETTTWLFSQKRFQHNVAWEDIGADKPQLLDFTDKMEIEVNGEPHQITVSIDKKVIKSISDYEIYPIHIEVKNLMQSTTVSGSRKHIALRNKIPPASSDKSKSAMNYLPERLRHR